MDLTTITNEQLYEIVQNNKLLKEIRKRANDELSSRGLDNAEITRIHISYQDKYKHANDPLEIKFRILAVIFPFLPSYWLNPFSMRYEIFFAGKFLSQGYKRKWKEYWIFSLLGYIAWTFLIVAIFKFYR